MMSENYSLVCEQPFTTKSGSEVWKPSSCLLDPWVMSRRQQVTFYILFSSSLSLHSSFSLQSSRFDVLDIFTEVGGSLNVATPSSHPSFVLHIVHSFMSSLTSRRGH